MKDAGAGKEENKHFDHVWYAPAGSAKVLPGQIGYQNHGGEERESYVKFIHDGMRKY